MTAKKAPSIKTEEGVVTVDAEASYRLTLAKPVTYLGHTMRPSDRNIDVTGEALVALAADAPEGAIINATPL